MTTHLKYFGLWWWFIWAVSGVPLLLCSGKEHRIHHHHHQFVQTSSGKVRGTINKTETGREVVRFLGVPYGKPPVGDLRFRLAQEVEPWKDAFFADKLATACYQWKDETFRNFNGSEMWNANTMMSEDCLNLNIWVPKGVSNATTLVWVFGGAFVYGSPSLDLYQGDLLASEGEVIVININYRVGPFGFLYFGDDLNNAPGNMGLADQQLALQWIKKNIRSFGGDPNKISLFGESAGAAGVSSHLLSEKSWDLFRYAILQSGTIMAPWALKSPNDVRIRALTLAEYLGCRRSSTKDTVNCLRTVPSDKLQQASDNITSSLNVLEFPFVPISRDVHYFEGDVMEKLRTGKFKKTALLVGTNTDEGSFWLPYYFSDYFNTTSDSLLNRNEYVVSISKAFQNHSKLVRNSVAFYYETYSSLATNKTKHLIESKMKSTTYRDLLSKIVGDYFFTCSVLNTADLFTNHGSVLYMYYFTERSTINPWPKWMGVMHGYEIEYIFGLPLKKPQEYTPQEIAFSRNIIQYWVNFAKNG